MRIAPLALASIILLCGCPKPAVAPDAGVNRCEVDLAATGYFKMDGTGAAAQVVSSPAQLIGGEGATGRAGDVLLQNDRVRVIVEQPGRTVGPILSGGGIVDADVVRAPGEPGRDAFGRTGLIYALGRISSITAVEVLSDGSQGGPAVVAASGHDVQHDLIKLKTLLQNQAGLTLDFVVDADKALPLRTTTYYVLSPGETRVRTLTAFCNDGEVPALAPLIELTDVGAFEIFIPGACTNALGTAGLDVNNSCTVTPAPFVSTQGDGVAYAMRSMQLNDLTQPATTNGAIAYGGVVGNFVEGESLNGILTWANPDARVRPGTFNVRAHGQRSYLRDFYVAKDLGGLTSEMLAVDGTLTGTAVVTARLPDGRPAVGARVSVIDAADLMQTLLVTDAAGEATVTLQPGDYRFSAAMEGRLVGPTASASVLAGGSVPVAVQVNDAHRLTVTVADPFGAPLPGKVVVHCAGGACPFSSATYRQHVMLEQPRGGAAAVDFVPPSGSLTLTLPPGAYQVVVSRGPEYSAWPDTWPASGFAVDLSQSDQTVNAVLAHTVDSTGWMSGDLHVHAVASSDSAVGNTQRAASFLAEGVDVLLSTDHDVITDFRPAVAALHGEGLIATMQGQEVTTFSHGHFNAFPLVRKDLPYGGAFDHAGGEDGPTPRMPQLFEGIKKAEHPGAVVQLNHPRGSAGVLSQLQVDTATLATHGVPLDFNMEPAPDATATDTRLFGDGFDLVETANGPSPSTAVMNDWMTFLSRGTVRTASGVSDTHTRLGDTPGYSRTYVHLGIDAPADFQPAQFADAIRAHKAFVTNGPFLTVTARALDGTGQPVGLPVDPGGTVSLAAGGSVEISVDVQGPAWMQLDRVELYSHAPGRTAINGESNDTWPDGRVLSIHPLDPLAMPTEAVPGLNGFAARRVHFTDRFVVQPTGDTWYVVMTRGLTGASLWPLHGSRPIAYSNAFLVDADGSGAYDDFPLKPGQPLTAVPPSPKRVAHVPGQREFIRALKTLIEHHHE